MPSFAHEDYPLLRESLAPAYENADPAQLRSIVQQIYGAGATPEDVEGFLGDLGRGLSKAAKGVGRFAQKALPGMAAGAMSGMALGPWGALAGAVAGGAGSLLSKSRNPTARAIGGGLSTATNLLSTVRGGGAGGALGALGSIASGGLGGGGNPLAGRRGGSGASQLMGMLARPELLQALQAATLGSFGRQAISIGGQQVPTHMLMNALGTVAQRAAHEMAEADEAAEAVPEFLVEASEALGLDVEDAEGRTDTLLTLLALSPAIWSRSQAAPGAPITVQVQPPAQTLPPILHSDEDWPEDSEDYGIEAWEAGGEDWENVDPSYWREEDPVYG
jgi:hypothetical protein